MTLTRLLLLTALASTIGGASTITFTETSVTSGTLDGTSFTAQLVTLTLSGDTSLITSPVSGIFVLTGPANVTVATVGSDTFSDTIEAVSNQGTADGGFSDDTLGGDDVLFTFNPALIT